MFQLSPDSLKKVKEEMGRYETVESAIIPALYIAQKDNSGWINPDVIKSLSHVMGLAESKINEVFKFYTMFNQKPVGQFHVQVCTNISCALEGGRELAEHICQELGVGLDEITKDGKFSVNRVECLGSCGTAPMMQVNDRYYENLTNESAMNTLRGMK